MIQKGVGGWYIDHSPSAKLDYSFDWSAWLKDAEEISDSSWAVDDADIILSLDSIYLGITTVFAEGGSLNKKYQLKNTITTNQGRADSRTLTLVCKTR